MPPTHEGQRPSAGSRPVRRALPRPAPLRLPRRHGHPRRRDHTPRELRRHGPNACGQVELYRDIWPRDATVVTCDLDTVVFRDFTPHRCPEGQLFMLRERGNWHRSAWAVWGAGLTVFRGDFSFIPRMFREDRLAGGERDPIYAHISSQEFITCALRAHGRLPMDIDPHLCARYYQGRPDSIVPDAHIAVFPAHPKPWEISPRPDWIPPLPED